jgi:hypothetical protein
MCWEKALITKKFLTVPMKTPEEAGVIDNNTQTAGRGLPCPGQRRSPTHRLRCVCGDGVKNSGNDLVPLGTLAKEVVEFKGGYADE